MTVTTGLSTPDPREVVRSSVDRECPHSPRFFMKGDGKGFLGFKESPLRDGPRTTEGKDITSKEDTVETDENREKGIER